MSTHPTSTAFIRAVEALAARAPTYRTGGTGADGTCDCIGATMGAMYALGHKKYALHSSNYFARYETLDLQPISRAEDCYPGMQVYKARADTGQLNARYLPGGRYHAGDMLDYYHAGIIISVNPFCVLHCTSGGGANGFVRDDRIGRWNYGGRLKGVDYGAAAKGGENMAESMWAYANAPTGSTVNLRARASRSAAVLARVPVGERVEVLSRGAGWDKVRHAGKTGWMMSEYLASSMPGKDTDGLGDASGNREWTLEALLAALEALEERVARLEARLPEGGWTEGSGPEEADGPGEPEEGAEA